MNPADIKNKLDDAMQAIDDLRTAFDMLSNSSTIPRDIENALRERLGLISGAGGTGSYPTQSISIASTPTSISVPSQPTGTIAIIIGGTTYNVLYK